MTVGMATLRKRTEGLTNVGLASLRWKTQDSQRFTTTGWATGDGLWIALAGASGEKFIRLEYPRFHFSLSLGACHMKANGRIAQKEELIELEQMEMSQRRTHRVFTHPLTLDQVFTEAQLSLCRGRAKRARLLQDFTQSGTQHGVDLMDQAFSHHNFMVPTLVVDES